MKLFLFLLLLIPFVQADGLDVGTRTLPGQEGVSIGTSEGVTISGTSPEGFTDTNGATICDGDYVFLDGEYHCRDMSSTVALLTKNLTGMDYIYTNWLNVSKNATIGNAVIYGNLTSKGINANEIRINDNITATGSSTWLEGFRGIRTISSSSAFFTLFGTKSSFYFSNATRNTIMQINDSTVLINSDFLISRKNCDTLDTDGSGKIICGTDGGGGDYLGKDSVIWINTTYEITTNSTMGNRIVNLTNFSAVNIDLGLGYRIYNNGSTLCIGVCG